MWTVSISHHCRADNELRNKKARCIIKRLTTSIFLTNERRSCLRKRYPVTASCWRRYRFWGRSFMSCRNAASWIKRSSRPSSKPLLSRAADAQLRAHARNTLPLSPHPDRTTSARFHRPCGRYRPPTILRAEHPRPRLDEDQQQLCGNTYHYGQKESTHGDQGYLPAACRRARCGGDCRDRQMRGGGRRSRRPGEWQDWLVDESPD